MSAPPPIPEYDIERVAQRFGGSWSVRKTEIVEQYLRFFNKALKGQNFERVYIDAFAGSGAFRYMDDPPPGGFFFPPPNPVQAGSAARALRCEPPFKWVLFIEKLATNVRALQQLIAGSGHPGARVYRGDANDLLQKICDPKKWRSRRGVVFLDPFGLTVDWETLQAIAATRALDVWYLFSLSGLMRCLPHNGAMLDKTKRSTVTRTLGTDAWLDEFYVDPPRFFSLTDGKLVQPPPKRRMSVYDVQRYVTERLKTIFPHVEQPRLLVSDRNLPLFSLYFAVSNPKPVAIRLATEAAKHILSRR